MSEKVWNIQKGFFLIHIIFSKFFCIFCGVKAIFFSPRRSTNWSQFEVVPATRNPIMYTIASPLSHPPAIPHCQAVQQWHHKDLRKKKRKAPDLICLHWSFASLNIFIRVYSVNVVNTTVNCLCVFYSICTTLTMMGTLFIYLPKLFLSCFQSCAEVRTFWKGTASKRGVLMTVNKTKNCAESSPACQTPQNVLDIFLLEGTDNLLLRSSYVSGKTSGLTFPKHIQQSVAEKQLHWLFHRYN